MGRRRRGREYEEDYVEPREERKGSCLGASIILITALVAVYVVSQVATQGEGLDISVLFPQLFADMGQAGSGIKILFRFLLGGFVFWLISIFFMVRLGITKEEDRSQMQILAALGIVQDDAGSQLQTQEDGRKSKRSLENIAVAFLERKWISGILEGIVSDNLSFEGGKELTTLGEGERIEDWRQQEWWIFHLKKTRGFLEFSLVISGLAGFIATLSGVINYLTTGSLWGSVPQALGKIFLYNVLAGVVFLIAYWVKEYERRNTLWIFTSFRMIYVKAGGSLQGLITGKSAESEVKEIPFEKVSEIDRGSHPGKLKGIRVPILWDELLDYMSARKSVRSFDMETYFVDPSDEALNVPHGPAFVDVLKKLIKRSREHLGNYIHILSEASLMERDANLGSNKQRELAAREHLQKSLPNFLPKMLVHVFAIRYRFERNWNDNGEEINPNPFSLHVRLEFLGDLSSEVVNASREHRSEESEGDVVDGWD